MCSSDLDAGVSVVVHSLDAISHGLNETVDQRSLNTCASSAHDATSTNGARIQIVEKASFEFVLASGRLDTGQRSCHPGIQIVKRVLTRFEVFFLQDVFADLLRRQRVGVAVQGVWVSRRIHQDAFENSQDIIKINADPLSTLSHQDLFTCAVDTVRACQIGRAHV